MDLCVGGTATYITFIPLLLYSLISLSLYPFMSRNAAKPLLALGLRYPDCWELLKTEPLEVNFDVRQHAIAAVK
jgi:hypothetical protein